VQGLIQNPQTLIQGVNDVADRARELPYVGEQIAQVDQRALTELVRSNAPSAGQVFQGAMGFIGGVFGVFGSLLNLLLLLIISIYLLLDRERITRSVLGSIPGMVRDHVTGLLHAVETTLVKYLKGQLALCAMMGIIGWAIAFFAIGDYALVIGLWVALTEIIPVLGAFLGAVPAVLIALFVQDGGVTTALVVAGLFLVAQQVEGNILVPRIMGGSVGVHPLWVLFATLAATTLYGIIGAIFAVPIVAIVAATLRYLRGTLIFERWDKAPLVPADRAADRTTTEPDPPASVTAGPDRAPVSSPERQDLEKE
jgi:predicted PurR-regulated permease PerM